MRVWLRVTKDKYRLPLAVADTAAELARRFGVTPNTVWSLASKHAAGQHPNSPYIRVDIEEDDENEL